MTSASQQIDDASTSNYIDIVDGELKLKLHYNDVGTGDSAVVLLHGSGPGATGWSNFSKNIEPLVKAGHRVILLDCPGWGKSDSLVNTGFRSELNARALKALMDGIELEKAHLIGNSMGASSCLAFALANPSRVERLVLMGGGAGGPSLFVPMPPEGIKRIADAYKERNVESLKRMMEVFIYDTSNLSEELFKARLDNMLSRVDHLDNFLASARANPKQHADVAHRLHEISAPTLVIWGRDDRFVPLDMGLRLVWGLQDAEMHIFSRCGHWAQWEHAEKFNRLVVDFFARTASTR